MTILACLMLAAGLTVPAEAASRTLFVAPGGSDAAAGTQAEPFGTLDHALSELTAGDTLFVRGGVYTERVRRSMPTASASAPTTVQAMPGEQPVVKGLLWLSGGSHWTLDGIDVTWDAATGASDEHMFRVVNGTDWVVRNAEVYGARAFAGMLIASTREGEPARWQLRDSCLRDTAPSNDTNQDHNLYVNSGLSAGSGLIEGNIFFGAPNGMNIKLGPPSDTGGSANVTVRHNTMYDAAQNVLISGESRNNVIERNIIGRSAGNYGNVRSYKITGHDNVARSNIGFDAASFILDYKGGNGIVDGGDNQFPLDPKFDNTATCDGFQPTSAAAAGHGHLAAPGTSAGVDVPDETTTDPEAPTEEEDTTTEPEAPTEEEDTTTEPEAPAEDETDSAKKRGGPFKDVPSNSVHSRAISTFSAEGIILGVDEHHFAPHRSITRGQLATMMIRMRDGSVAPVSAAAASPFVDASSLPHGPNIAVLAETGIVFGKTSTTFSPGSSLTRGQLASILIRAFEHEGGVVPDAPALRFDDIAGDAHETAIRQAAALGFVRGTGDGQYQPDQAVTRAQFASTLHHFREVSGS